MYLTAYAIFLWINRDPPDALRGPHTSSLHVIEVASSASDSQRQTEIKSGCILSTFSYISLFCRRRQSYLVVSIEVKIRQITTFRFAKAMNMIAAKVIGTIRNRRHDINIIVWRIRI